MEAQMNLDRVLVGKPKRKRTLGRPRRGRVDNIKTTLGAI
jgi:hypothetical protein